MNFTREPIIETIITPKEGHKLVIRNTKGSGGEEHIVDAVEVISFGHSFFFRSSERPKPFLVPVSDYEVVEAKETRVVLKNATFERSIKIGGGKKAAAEPQEPAAVEERLEKKRERRRHRRRRTPEETQAAEEVKATEGDKPTKAKAVEGGGAEDETPKVSSSPVSRLIPPPLTLISDKIAKEKAAAPEEPQGDVLPEPVEEKPKRGRRKKVAKKEEKPPQEEQPEEKPSAEEQLPKAEEQPPKKEASSEEAPSQEEGGDMQRVAQEPLETVGSTSFSTVEGSKDASFFGKIW